MIVKCNFNEDQLNEYHIGIYEPKNFLWSIIAIGKGNNKISTEMIDNSLYFYIPSDIGDIVMEIPEVNKYDLFWKCYPDMYMIYVCPRTMNTNNFIIDKIKDVYHDETGGHIYFKKED